MTDFPDRDEWTDRPLSGEVNECPECGLPIMEEIIGLAYWIKDYKTCQCKKLKARAEEAMEDAEWDALGETDLIDPEERL